MNPITHGLKEAYKQLGRNTFCGIFLTVAYLLGAGGFGVTNLAIAGYAVSSILLLCAGVSGSLSLLSFVAHYFNLFKVYVQNTTTKQSIVLRHSSRHVDIPGWVVHRVDGPAVSGFDVHSEEQFQLFFFEGTQMKKEIYEKIAHASTKGDLNEFLTSPDEHQRNFAKFKMRSL